MAEDPKPTKIPVPSTLEECDSLLARMGDAKDKLVEDMRKLRQHRDRLAARASAGDKLAKMSDTEREAVLAHAQTLGAQGVASAESHGTPGS